MDPFTIAALVAAVAGAGLQYQASSDDKSANSRPSVKAWTPSANCR